MAYSGERRRSGDNGTQTTHDLVIRIDENVKTLKEKVIQANLNFETHKEDDDKNFKALHARIDPIKNALLRISGAWMVVVFLLALLMKFFKW